jgi:hypothetical protein
VNDRLALGKIEILSASTYLPGTKNDGRDLRAVAPFSHSRHRECLVYNNMSASTVNYVGDQVLCELGAYDNMSHDCTIPEQRQSLQFVCASAVQLQTNEYKRWFECLSAVMYLSASKKHVWPLAL